MKYDIDISVGEGFDKGTGLGVMWQVDTTDPQWQIDLRSCVEHMEAVIVEHATQRSTPLNTDHVVRLLKRLGYHDHAAVIEDLMPMVGP